MSMRSRSWVVGLILLGIGLLAATWMGPDMTAASTCDPAHNTLESATPANRAEVSGLAALLYGDPTEPVGNNPLELALQGGDNELVDFESLVKVGDDDTPRGTFPRRIQTLTDPSLFARLHDDRFTEAHISPIQTAIATLPPAADSDHLISLQASKDGVYGFNLAPPTSVTGIIAVPEPGTLALIGAAAITVTATARARRVRDGDRK